MDCPKCEKQLTKLNFKARCTETGIAPINEKGSIGDLHIRESTTDEIDYMCPKCNTIIDID